MEKPSWFRPRGYRHLDAPVSVGWACKIDPEFVAAHSWSPLIHYIKKQKRYKLVSKKTTIAPAVMAVETKPRHIMFASHRDACILSKYSAEIVKRLDVFYEKCGLNSTVIAYRSLGKSNYHFAADVQEFVRQNDPLIVMCFDVSGFFDSLNHRKLKARLKWLLGLSELPADWLQVFRTITKYRHVEKSDIDANGEFKARIAESTNGPIATILEIKAAGIQIHPNANDYGIPQGTPISASASNLYLVEFDQLLKAEADKIGALYKRYSDDILIACKPEKASEIENIVLSALQNEGLEVNTKKTEKCLLSGNDRQSFQYLGFQLGLTDATVRSGSMSKQWRSTKRALRKAEKSGLARTTAGKSKQVYTRKLVGKFTHVGSRNFISYVNRSADELESSKIRKQAKKLHRYALKGIAQIKKIKPI
jgi:RNA-directed DNA polymerase